MTIPDLIDFRDIEFRRNSFETYKRLRQDRPVARGRLPLMGDAWLITRYEDVVALCRDRRFRHDSRALPDVAAKRAKATRWLPRALKIMTETMIIMDDPDHVRLRKLAGKAFSAHRIRQIEDQIRDACADLAEPLQRSHQPLDLMQSFAIPLPLRVIADMLGVSARYRDRFRRIAGGFIELGTRPKWTIPLNMIRGEILLRDIGKLIQARRETVFDDLLYDLVQAESEGDRLSHRELEAMIMLLLLAGHETTSNLIGLSTLTLMRQPEAWEQLRGESTLSDSAVEELLRFTSPVEHGVQRWAMEDVEIAGQVIRKGEAAVPVFASANHDETMFENPETLNFERKPNRHVAFGMGGHLCLGAPLARMEAKHALPHVINTFLEPKLAVAENELKWRPSTAARGLQSLPLQPAV